MSTPPFPRASCLKDDLGAKAQCRDLLGYKAVVKGLQVKFGFPLVFLEGQAQSDQAPKAVHAAPKAVYSCCLSDCPPDPAQVPAASQKEAAFPERAVPAGMLWEEPRRVFRRFGRQEGVRRQHGAVWFWHHNQFL